MARRVKLAKGEVEGAEYGRRAYKFRLYPTSAQQVLLLQQLETLRRVYNDALQLRKDIYALTGKSPKSGYLRKVVMLSRNAQLDDLKEKRGGPKWLTQVASTAVRDTVARVETAFDNFFRSLKSGDKPGFPRFKGYGRLRSIPFENYASGCVLRNRAGVALRAGFPADYNGYRLDLFGVGLIKVVAHQSVEGRVTTACVKRDVDGKWYVVLVTKFLKHDPPKSDLPSVGIDVGIKSFVTTSDGEAFENPRYLKASLKRLRRRQRSSSRKLRAAKSRKVKFRTCRNLQKSFLKVAQVHVLVRNQRKEMHYKVARSLVSRYGKIAFEGLRVKNMLKNKRLARSISDAGWSAFLGILRRKAESAGGSTVEVDARGTSQKCSNLACGKEVPKSLSDRWHDCPHCGLSLDRDHNAAVNILNRARFPSNSAGHADVRLVAKGSSQANPSSGPRERSREERVDKLLFPRKHAARKSRKANRSWSGSQTPTIPGME